MTIDAPLDDTKEFLECFSHLPQLQEKLSFLIEKVKKEFNEKGYDITEYEITWDRMEPENICVIHVGKPIPLEEQMLLQNRNYYVEDDYGDLPF